MIRQKIRKFAEICCVLSFFCLIKSRKDNIMKKDIMKSLTDEQMTTLTGGAGIDPSLFKFNARGVYVPHIVVW